MRRSIIVVVALMLATASCGGSDGSPEARATSTVPGASTTEAPATGDVPTTANPDSSGTAPTLQVVQYAKAGETPPGRTGPLDFPGWRASGSRWKPGDVDLVVRVASGGSTVLDVGARADASGSWEQTFVLRGATPGSYMAVASQGSLRAEAGSS